MNLEISQIQVLDRQRQNPEIDQTFTQSVGKNLIHPIVLRREDDTIILVAGGRRLAALKAFGQTILVENTHFRFIENLSPHDAQILELEENVKRADLSWRDHVAATGRIHDLYVESDPTWKVSQTAEAINMSLMNFYTYRIVYQNLSNPALRDALSIQQAYSILQTIADRRAASIITKIRDTGGEIFKTEDTAHVQESVENVRPLSMPSTSPPDLEESPEETTKSSPSTTSRQETQNPPKEKPPIVCADFLSWLADYSGPKFNLIHCDFPYDVDYSKYAKSVTSSDEDYDHTGYFDLLDGMCSGLDKFVSYSAHIVFWFSMKFYEQTRTRLLASGLFVHEHPLVWLKSDNAGIIPGGSKEFPRRIYETAFLCSRGRRPLVKPLSNAYASPTAPNPIHPSHKPEPMLRHFLSMLIDETTDVFDPTAGSGAALRAAEDCGARSILGLELSSHYAESANATTLAARQAREAKK